MPPQVVALRDRAETREAAVHDAEIDARLRAISPRSVEIRRARDHFFDNCADPREFRLGLLTGGHIQHRTSGWYQTGRLFGIDYRYPLLDLGVVEAAIRLAMVGVPLAGLEPRGLSEGGGPVGASVGGVERRQVRTRPVLAPERRPVERKAPIPDLSPDHRPAADRGAAGREPVLPPRFWRHDRPRHQGLRPAGSRRRTGRTGPMTRTRPPGVITPSDTRPQPRLDPEKTDVVWHLPHAANSIAAAVGVLPDGVEVDGAPGAFRLERRTVLGPMVAVRLTADGVAVSTALPDLIAWDDAPRIDRTMVAAYLNSNLTPDHPPAGRASYGCCRATSCASPPTGRWPSRRRR